MSELKAFWQFVGVFGLLMILFGTGIVVLATNAIRNLR